MKKHVLLAAAILFAAGTTTFLSCSHEHGEDTHTHGDGGEHEDTDADGEHAEGDGHAHDDDGATEEELSSTLYQCPSDCGEGEAFWEPGECSACGTEMDVLKDAV